jgi:hypothetical protein
MMTLLVAIMKNMKVDYGMQNKHEMEVERGQSKECMGPSKGQDGERSVRLRIMII